jgi:uncharacterized membrane protein YkvA (DUF1232 family)
MVTMIRDALAWLRDPAVPAVSKWIGLFAIIYVASPVDLIPDWVPLVGWLDDLGVIALAAAHYGRKIRGHRIARAALERDSHRTAIRQDAMSTDTPIVEVPSAKLTQSASKR